MQRKTIFWHIFWAFCCLFMVASARAQVHPLEDGGTVEGVTTCQGSMCHSRQAATGFVVRQNEVLTWQDPSRSSGAHSRAYQVLTTPQGQRISRLAGFGPAETAPECLSCHAHDVNESRRGDSFNISEGVTCEACHGSAGIWLETHAAAGATHEANIANGLYPTDKVELKASLCLDCHFGSDRANQFVTHRIMGAGHPRMSFELELFNALQQHHTVDDDYLARKSYTPMIQTWAVGQAMAMERAATLLMDDELGQDGIFPELYFFDCHACHQAIPSDREAFATWRANPSRPLGPGVPLFNDANLIMLRAALSVTAPQKYDELRDIGIRLHRGTTQGRSAMLAAADDLASYSRVLRGYFLDTDFDATTTMAILNQILADTTSAEYTNYAAGEQAVIAVDVFLNAMLQEGAITVDDFNRLAPKIDRAFDTVQKPTSYDPARLRNDLQSIAASTRSL